MKSPLENLQDIFAWVQEHYVKGPELYALHPAEFMAVIERLGLVPNRRGGYSQPSDTFGTVGPRFVPDGFVSRGTVEVWNSASRHRERYLERVLGQASGESERLED